MKILLTVGILLVCDYTVLYAQDNAEEYIDNESYNKLLEFVKSVNEKKEEADKILNSRLEFAEATKTKAKALKWNDKLKIPEIDCDNSHDERTAEIKKDLEKEQEEEQDVGKLIERLEEEGEETMLSCMVPSRTEINCKSKKCEKRYIGICICGPKKCDVDDDGLCESGSSSVFTFGVIVNFCIFYLIVSFF
ncbi:hypothetical protein CRE_21819 [Caenorhabditis remanei]|uniref:EB domain-containing protein n=1 Tax=Caenorhabditis remanei TaxID=31234 RepID=E3MEM6_CAERE|nr:hypothetical protein CRE_21819 [Caenorhabditis remanei]